MQKKFQKYSPKCVNPTQRVQIRLFHKSKKNIKTDHPKAQGFLGFQMIKAHLNKWTQLLQIQSHWKKLHWNHHLGVGFDQHFTTKGSDWLLEKEWCMTSWKIIGDYSTPLYSCYGPPWRCILLLKIGGFWTIVMLVFFFFGGGGVRNQKSIESR